MATKPTRGQEAAADVLAGALLAIAEAARLDGRSGLEPPKFVDLAGRVAAVSSAIGRDEIVARALEARGRSLGLRSGTADLLMLVDAVGDPLAALLGDDEAFRGLVARAEAELGEV